MELIDLYNPDGSPRGETGSRDEAHRLGLWHKTVHVWVLTPAGKLLLQKRSREKESHPGLWDISAAGHITAGDSSVQTAVRELEEELGITADGNDLRLLFSLFQCYEDFSRPFIDREITDVYLLQRDVDPDALRVGTREVETVRLVITGRFRKELSENPSAFAPHKEEYGKLLEMIEGVVEL